MVKLLQVSAVNPDRITVPGIVIIDLRRLPRRVMELLVRMPLSWNHTVSILRMCHVARVHIRSILEKPARILSIFLVSTIII